MTEFELCSLADRPEFLNACAAWAYGRWGVQKPDGSLERSLKYFGNTLNPEVMSITIVAINKQNGLPIAMGSLWEQDGKEWPDTTPWIASIFTLYRYRGQGIAKAIIERLEGEAKKLGYSKVYLKSGTAATYYPKLGYKAIDTKKVETNAAGMETLLCKDL